MFDQYLAQLSSPDVAQRREAIIALGKSGDTRALTPLANIYKSDPDPALRELALKAGRYLKGATTSVPAVAATSSAVAVTNSAATAIVPAPEIAKPEPKPRELTYADRQKAKNRLDTAIGLVAQANNERALVELVDAIRINPELAKDTVALNLASTVTGILSTSEAMESIVRQAQEPVKKKPISRDTGTQNTGTVEGQDNTIIIFLIAMLVIFILSAASTVLVRAGLVNSLTILSQAVRYTPKQLSQIQLATNQLRAMAPGALFVGTVVEVIVLAINFGILYGIGSLMGGTGSIVPFFSRLLRVQIVMTIVVMIEAAILFYGVIQPRAAPSQMVGAIQSILVVIGFTYVAGLVWEGYATAVGHEISVGRGCLARFISVFLFAFLAACLAFVAGPALFGTTN